MAAPRRQTAHPAVVRVQANDSHGSSLGSGTLVDVRDDYALVVTNWHVVRDAPQHVTVTFPNGFQTAARVIRMDRHWDLAALVVWNPGNVEPVGIATTAPQPGDALTIAGYGAGNYRSAEGKCTQYLAPGANFPYEMVEVSVQARQGDSGGPIFNHQGELAGVLFGAGRGTTSGSYAGRVQQFLLTAWPDLGTPDKVMIADTASAKPSQTRPKCVASIACRPKPQEQTTNQQHNIKLSLDPKTTSKRRAKLQPRQDRTVAPKLSPARSYAAPAQRPTPGATYPEVIYPSSPSTPPVQLDHHLQDEIMWEDLVGHTPFQQAKTLFALIGVVVTMLSLVNFSGNDK